MVHFRKTFYFKMIIVITFLGFIFFGALLCIYQMSCRRFEEELSYYSNTLTGQICRNVEVSLEELSENTVPLIATNERFGPILIRIDQGASETYLKLRIQFYLDELMGMNYDLNWMAVVDSTEEIYLAGYASRQSDLMPDKSLIKELYLSNKENLGARSGNTVWISSSNPHGIILMRSIFDSDSMQFCGCIMAEVKTTSIKEIFENIDSAKVGDFTLYDRNGVPIYSTCTSPEEKSKNLLQTEYPISRGKLKIIHVVDLKEKNQSFSDFLYLTSSVGLFAFIAVIVFLWLMFGNMARNLKILVENLHRVSVGEFELESGLSEKDDELGVLASNIREMAVRIKELMDKEVKNKEIQEQNRYALLEARYHGLQAQINPHFLFNAFQSINGIAQINENIQVSRLICMLSKFFRGSIDRNYTFCELTEELEYARNYLEFYKEIYPGRLDIRWNVEERLLGAKIPTYILQPIVENSLVHGMEPMVGICTIKISVYEEDGKLIISVWDNGEGMKPERLEELRNGKGESKRVGIRNVQDRIQILYGRDYGVFLESQYLQYTEAKIILPMP